MVTIAMCLGFRVSEILALKWSDFDFEDGTLMVTRGTVHARIGRVKTEYSEDEMPLDPAFGGSSCMAGVARPVGGMGFPEPEHWRSLARFRVARGHPGSRQARRSVSSVWAGTSFRHSYRSMLDACGAPIGVQQKLMRHAR